MQRALATSYSSRKRGINLYSERASRCRRDAFVSEIILCIRGDGAGAVIAVAGLTGGWSWIPSVASARAPSGDKRDLLWAFEALVTEGDLAEQVPIREG